MALHPILKRLIAKAYLNGFGNIHLFTPDQMRLYLSHPNLKVKLTDYIECQTDKELKIRCYWPTQYAFETRLPVVVYLSANAFVIDRLEFNHGYCSLLADSLDMKIIMIAHRLAPEHQFPTFLYDVIQSIQWIAQQADTLMIDPEKIAIWGESSGATIAASVTHLLRDQRCPIIKHQTLFYPMVDLVHSFASKEKYGQGYMLDKSFIGWLDQQSFHPEQDRAHPWVSPLLFPSFAGLPPATIITAEYDPLRDEAEKYAEKLRKAHVPTITKRFDGMIHGFMRFYNKVDVAKEALAFSAKLLKAQFSKTRCTNEPF